MYRTTAGKAVESQEAEKQRPIQLAVRPRGDFHCLQRQTQL